MCVCVCRLISRHRFVHVDRSSMIVRSCVCVHAYILLECQFVRVRVRVRDNTMSAARVCIFLLKGAIDHLYMSVVVCVCV